MTKKSRRGLFYGLIALFLVLGTGVVFYAQGWRLDLPTGLVSKIGAIYIRSYPKEASIAINGKPVQNKIGFLSPGTLISDLFPKTYAVQLTEPGYDLWRENVTVLPSLVAPLQYAVLVPQSGMTVASGTTTRFFATQGIVAKENSSGSISINGNVIGQGTLASATADAHAFMFEDMNGAYRLYGIGNSTTTNLSVLLAKDGIAASMIQNIVLDPHDDSRILVMGQKKIWVLDLTQQSLTLIEKTPDTKALSPSVAMNGALIIWTRFESASNISEIVLNDRAAGTLRETSTTFPGATEKMRWIHGDLFGILQSDGSLYLYDSGPDTIRKIADDVKDFSASEDGTMIAALGHANTEIFTLADPDLYYRFNLPDTRQIRQFIWYKDNNHLFVVYPDSISFLDLQDTDLANFTTVAKGTSPSYDVNSNSLYFMTPTSQLTRFQFPN